MAEASCPTAAKTVDSCGRMVTDTAVIGIMNRMSLLQTAKIGEHGWDLIPGFLFSLLAGESMR